LKSITIGTRGSKLALWQANFIKSKIEEKFPSLKVEIKIIKTTGDKILDVPLAKVGGKGLFVKEIEEELLSRGVDIAVHSMKDVPTFFPDGLYLPIITEREDCRDAFISKDNVKLSELKAGSIIGTSSLRRRSQLCSIRKDLNIVDLRGNIDTRLTKLKKGEYDAIILASAGLKRMGFENSITEYISVDQMIPAIGQGALGIETRIGDTRVLEIVSFLKDEKTYKEVEAERGFLKKLEGGCQVPIGCFAQVEGKSLSLNGFVGSVDGTSIIKESLSGSIDDFDTLGVTLAEKILKMGGKEILDQVYGCGDIR